MSSAMTSLLRALIPEWIKQTYVSRLVRLWLNYRFTIRPRLLRQLSSDHGLSARHESVPKRRVLLPLVETSHYQYLHLLVVAKALELRGCEVLVLLCGEELDGCEIKSSRNETDRDPCLLCRFNARNLVPMFGFRTLTFAELLGVNEITAIRREAEAIVAGGQCVPAQNGIEVTQPIEDSMLRYFFGAIPDDVARERRVRIAHTSTVLTSAAATAKLEAEWRPDIVLSNMTCYSAWDYFFRFFKANGDRFRQISMSPFNFHAVVLDSHALFPANVRFDRYLQARRNDTLNTAEQKALQAFLSERSSGKAQIFVRDGYFADAGDNESICERLNIDRSKRNIFLFSNLHWDVGLSEQSGLFPDVIAWVLDTIEMLRNEPGVQLYVKPHPADVYNSARSEEGVVEKIRKRYPAGIANLTVIAPEWQIKAYDLFPFIDLGVIFTGTLGLEMMLSGVPVVSTGLTAHKGMGFAAEPDDLESYRRFLLGAQSVPDVNRERLALFAYFYFLRARIPWTLTKVAYDNSNFDGFEFDRLSDLAPGHDALIDHLCDYILEPAKTVVEDWPRPSRQAEER